MPDEGPISAEAFAKSGDPGALVLNRYLDDPRAPRAEEVGRMACELAARLADAERHNQELRAAQRQLEDYRDRYIDLYDSAPLGYVSLDEDGYIQEINLAGAAWLGKDRAALTGYSFADYVVKEDVPMFLDHVRRCVADRSEVTSELRLLADGGLSRTVQFRSVPVADAKHELTLCKTAIADVTERKRAEQAARDSEARHRAILEASVDAIITIDERGIIDSVNPATQRLFGYPPAELIGASVNVLMPSPHRELHDTYLENYRRTGQAKIIGIGREVTGRRKDGSLFPMDLSVSEIVVAGRRMFVGLVHDISDRKQAEEELRQSRDALEQRVHERTAELTALNKRLQYERHLFDTLMDHVPHGIFFKDAEGRYIRVNTAKARAFGLPDADLVDWKEVLKAVAGDAAGVDRVVHAALEESPRLLTTIRAAIESHDRTALRLVAHTLKGSLQYFGAARLCELAHQLEHIGQEGDLHDAPSALADLEDEMTRFVHVLANESQESRESRFESPADEC
jgi:PAS domain S-box-containing protein